MPTPSTLLHSRRALFCLSAAAALVLTAPPAPSFSLADGQTERDAELLVVGNYPAKGLKVTEADLDHIVAQFSADTVPIKIEHISSPLDPLGSVSRLWRDGKKLMGRIAFDSLAAPLIAKRAVKGLSVGLDYLAGTRQLCLSEVSLTLKPFIPSAALLSGPHSSDDDTSDDDTSDDAADRTANLDRIANLEAKLAALDADGRIQQLKRQGKIVPATELLARQLLSAPDGAAIRLADGSTGSVADAAFALLSALPATVRFTETAPAKNKPAGKQFFGGAAGAAASGSADGEDEDDLPELTPDQHSFCVNVLKVDPQKVRQTMKTTKRIGTSDMPPRGAA